MKKIALILKEELSAWKSCQTITSNLEKSYLKAFSNEEVIILKIGDGFNKYNGFKLALDLKNKNIDLIVWLDHKPNSAILLEALDTVFKEVSYSSKPKFIVHLYGDFVLDCLAWQRAFSSANSWPIHFFIASAKQKQLVESFFKFEANSISVLPFPVNENNFYFKNSESDKKLFKNKYNIASDDLVILYTGRVSYQKNIELLTKIFSSISKIYPQKIHLLIAGEWDDILQPYSGKFGPLGSYYAQFQGTSKSYLSNEIQFLGKLNSKELLDAYNGADLFVSFSTYNDEDYGMSPAEALSCGLPCLLSNWGGYTSFRDFSTSVDLIPVSFGDLRPQVNVELARKYLMKALSDLPKNYKGNKKIATESKEKISIEAIANKISQSIDTLEFGPILELSNKFLKLCVLTEMNPGSPFKKGKKLELSEFYKDVYENYGS